MTKIGVIRCQETATTGEHRCAGWNCFPAIQNKTGYMDEYNSIELVGFDTCGGCPGKNNVSKIVNIGNDLKKHGAETIHLGTCLTMSCPNKDMFKSALEEQVGIPVKDFVHGGPDGKRAPVGPDGKPIFGPPPGSRS